MTAKKVPIIQGVVEESPNDYGAGGYLPVCIGDEFNNHRYTVIRKLGWGHFSTVWLVRDRILNRHSAIKVVKSARSYGETARDEIKLLNRVAAAQPLHPGHQHIISFLDAFVHHPASAPSVSHVCMVFQPLGPSLLSLLTEYRNKGTATRAGGLPLELVRLISQQMLLGIQYLHEECGLIHTDIKPENVLVSIPDIESAIRSTLASTSSTPSRLVGIPAGLSRGGNFTPRIGPVHIFDSQPLPSPKYSPYSSSNSSVNTAPSPIIDKLALQMSAINVSPDSPSATKTSTDECISTAVSSPPTSYDGGSNLRGKGSGHESDSLPSPPRHSLLTQTAPYHERSEDLYAPAPLSPSSTTTRSSIGCSNLSSFSLKIADLGNATPISKHYTNEIQTRQYRAPEIIIGRTDWTELVDMWSVACVIFEMITGDFLFEPKAYKSEGREVFSKDDDHMAQIIELFDDFDFEFKMGGRFSRELFNQKGHMRRIRTFRFWPLQSVLMEKYFFTAAEAIAMHDFLETMLVIDPRSRATAAQMLEHPWLAGVGL